MIFSAFSKSGGSQFHGEGYIYARNSVLNSWDAYTKSQYLSDIQSFPSCNQFANWLAPAHFYYPGGNVGGPIIFLSPTSTGSGKSSFSGPATNTCGRHPAGGPIDYNTPTAEQKTGDFTNTTINGVPGSPSWVLATSSALQTITNFYTRTTFPMPSPGLRYLSPRTINMPSHSIPISPAAMPTANTGSCCISECQYHPQCLQWLE